jgi:hypothetical protein
LFQQIDSDREEIVMAQAERDIRRKLRILKRHGINRLPSNERSRTVLTHRYEKQVPGHHIQVDVKFLKLESKKEGEIRRFQYTAIDDATRIRTLEIYNRHTQQNAIHFIDHMIERFPFRIHTVRTYGHEFQARFHWHVEDLGIKHLRWAVVEAEWPAGRADCGISMMYQRIARRRAANPAKIATTRRLLTIIYRMLKEKRGYEFNEVNDSVAFLWN